MDRLALVIITALMLSGCQAAPHSTKTSSAAIELAAESTSTEPPGTNAASAATTTTNAPATNAPNPYPVGTMRLTAIDVGQGAAILIELPDAVLLVDAANRFTDSTAALLSYLQSHGIGRVDALIISNPDADHAGGCNEVFRDLEVAAFYHQGYPKETQTWQDCLAAATAEGAATYTDTQLNPGDLLPLSRNATVRLLNINAGGSEVNPGSIAMRVDYGDFSFILPGDIECAQEDQIRAAFGVDVDVIQVAHHGSKYGTCDAWLDATTPEAAFIPVGSNSYGHPTPETLGRLSARGIATYRTDQHGDVTFTSDGKSWTVANERNAPAPSTTSSPAPPPPPPPAPPPQGSGGVTITSILADPSGDDLAYGAGEYVSIRNGGAANADLTGWTLSDSANHDYTFPAFTLAPNASVKVHTGSGSNSATDLFQGRGTGIWNNTGGDEATLRDASGALVDTYSY